jgi:hypothetical protein
LEKKVKVAEDEKAEIESKFLALEKEIDKVTANSSCETCDSNSKDKYNIEEHTKKHASTESSTVSDIEVISETVSIDVESESNDGSDLPKVDEKTFKCDKCNFKSSSDHGIKIHKAKKHSAQDYYNSLYALSPRGLYPPRFPPTYPPRFPHSPMW